MKFDSVIFDVDGTLWNASPGSAKGWEIAFREIGEDIKVTAEQIESIAGKPFDECVETLFPGLQLKYPDVLDKLSEGEKTALIKEGGDFYQGVLDGIPELARQKDVYLVSNCQDWYMELFLDFSGLRKVISGYDSNGMSGNPKDIMLQNIKSKYSLNNPIYVGDTAGDETACKKAKVPFLHATYGFGTPIENPPTADSFQAVLDYVKE